ncbi:hypothetical protein S7335_1360 [Synechococcus sp. PCC 7335]|uniref:DUF1824 family protein n=1 Tax=Synechococcus sp. (strain ATCC 29403 / PCC 7335) TaxID=91464 RepID=UPI00017EBC66|nr:DUF1824 family protein [Synechococcus sp. PCC 7335]EDX83663.1 hypothetical protein S7335_1360 [Synechococcus sp. PCC 7335]
MSIEALYGMSKEAIAIKLKAVRRSLVKATLDSSQTALSEQERQTVCAHLLWLNQMSEYQTLGICASTIAFAEVALKEYVSALSQPISVDLPNQSGAVFLKFNTLKNAWYLDSYSGDARGVLVTYHTSEPELEDINGTYGYFPLDLFSSSSHL